MNAVAPPAGAGTARFVAVGAGRMGRGIAIAFAYAGHRIALVDLRQRRPAAWQALREEALAEIRGALQALARLGAIEEDRIAAIAARVELVDAGGAAAALATPSSTMRAASFMISACRRGTM